jgi:hypothetical protein
LHRRFFAKQILFGGKFREATQSRGGVGDHRTQNYYYMLENLYVKYNSDYLLNIDHKTNS